MLTLGITVVDWRLLTMWINNEHDKMTLQGDPSLTKSKVSLKRLLTAWDGKDQGLLVECRDLSVEALSEKEEVEVFQYEVPRELYQLIHDHEEVFRMPKELPPHRTIDHQIYWPEGLKLTNVRPYRYAHAQKKK